MNYYNDNDPRSAAWLQSLVNGGLIPPGKVDGRSITEITPHDLEGFTQCHFFAGIGGWPVALALAGVPSTTPLWTGSCPCQPFSGAGRRRGAEDARHLWPAWFALIAQCCPATILGEQVDKELGRVWLAAVRADVETLGYAWGGADLCAAGAGAPHIRQRHYWVAHAAGVDFGAGLCHSGQAQQRRHQPSHSGSDGGGVGNSKGKRWGQGNKDIAGSHQRSHPQGIYQRGAGSGGISGGLGDPQHAGLEGHAGDGETAAGWPQQDRPTGAAGFWDDCAYVLCREPGGDKIRPAEPGTYPVADGLPRRVVEALLHGYGNAIVPQQAAAFIRAVM